MAARTRTCALWRAILQAVGHDWSLHASSIWPGGPEHGLPFHRIHARPRSSIWRDAGQLFMVNEILSGHLTDDLRRRRYSGDWFDGNTSQPHTGGTKGKYLICYVTAVTTT